MPTSKRAKIEKLKKTIEKKLAPKPPEKIDEVKKSLFEEKEAPKVEPKTPTTAPPPVKDDEKQEEVEVAQVKVEETSSSTVKNLLPATIGFIIGIITTSLFMYYYDLQSKKADQAGQLAPITVTVSPTTQPQATDSASLVQDLALYDIQVLNGSGKGGEAGKLEKKLKAEGFAVFEVGNADKSDYKKTVIKAKKKVPETFLDKLKTYLKTQFEVEENVDTLADSEKTEIVIIVGSSSVAQSTPSATITTKPTP